MTKLLLIITATAAVIGLLYFRHEQRTQVERLRDANTAMEETVARAEDAEQRGERFKRELLQLEAAQLIRSAATLATNVSSAKAREEHPAAKLFRNPEMRASMKKQHEKAIERSAKQLVSSNLVEKLNLTPEQARALRDLVQKKQAPGAEMTMALMSGELTDTELAALGRSVREKHEAADAEIRALLGDDKYAAFAWHEDSQAERSRIWEFRAKMTETGAPFTAELEEALIRAMHEERAQTSFTHDFHNPHNFDMDRLPEIFSEESLNQFIREMEDMNNRIILRAQEMLDPQQSGEFAQSLRDQFEKSKITVRMTAALFPVRRRN